MLSLRGYPAPSEMVFTGLFLVFFLWGLGFRGSGFRVYAFGLNCFHFRGVQGVGLCHCRGLLTVYRAPQGRQVGMQLATEALTSNMLSLLCKAVFP